MVIYNQERGKVIKMKLTIQSINSEFRSKLKMPCYGKGKFGWYSVTLNNGRVLIASTLKELRDYIIKELK